METHSKNSTMPQGASSGGTQDGARAAAEWKKNPLRGHAILFLPGMDGTGISFEPLRKVLPKNIPAKVVQYPVDRFLSFEQTVRWVKQQMPSFQENVIVIAESFSGPVAAALVGSGQIKPKCLILCSTFARSPRPLLLKLLCYLPTEYLIEYLVKIPCTKALFKHVVEGGQAAADLFFDMWQEVNTRVPAAILAHRLQIISRVDVRRWLPRITIPCCYIQPTSDKSVPSSCLFDFIELIPDLRVKRLRGPHFILQARPQACLEIIQKFVERIDSLEVLRPCLEPHGMETGQTG
jgi:pimeloyl-[acyl-carrier protein] methyl ester esterase